MSLLSINYTKVEILSGKLDPLISPIFRGIWWRKNILKWFCYLKGCVLFGFIYTLLWQAVQLEEFFLEPEDCKNCVCLCHPEAWGNQIPLGWKGVVHFQLLWEVFTQILQIVACCRVFCEISCNKDVLAHVTHCITFSMVILFLTYKISDFSNCVSPFLATLKIIRTNLAASFSRFLFKGLK